MLNTVIIGTGNLAFQLANVFYETEEIHVTQICGRAPSLPSGFYSDIDYCSTYEALLEADVYVIAVSDSAIASVVKQLPFKDRLVVHTAGAVSMEVLEGQNRKGVFYPLQSFSKNTTTTFTNIPICVEAFQPKDHELLIKIANYISNSVYTIDSQQRLALHTAAVFVNNFTNHLYQIGFEICEQHNLPFEVLKPIIIETAHKIANTSPKEVQTGPAKRGDTDTLKKHINSITDKKHLEIYNLLTQHILSQHGKNIL
ncbi:MAG: DUF2520 domain-containing protein [Flavobacteriaceae bacterium]|nr:DUF2520 domain-containing protein [Flavobacteriaceae bacterium]